MWYLQKKGRTEGPLPEATLRRAIEKKEIGALDLLYREGDDRWRVAAEFNEWADLFKTPAAKDAEVEWVFLTREPGKANYLQKGPFRTSEVKRKLKTGEIRWSDYAWRSGMKEWYRVTALEIFHGEPAPESDLDPILRDQSFDRKELLKSVEVFEPPAQVTAEERPPEAEGEDLAAKKEKNQPAARPEKKSRQVKTKKGPEAAPLVAQRISFWHRLVEKSPSEKTLISSFFVFMTVGAVLSALLWSSYRDHLSLVREVAPERYEEKIAEPEKTQAQAPAPPAEPVTAPAPRPEPATPPPQPQVEVRKEPTRLSLQVKSNKGESPYIEWKTDASSHFRVQFEVKSVFASVLESRSFYRRLSLVAREPFRLEFKAFPDGVYEVQARFEGEHETVAARTRVEKGTASKGFSSKLQEHRKAISYYAMNERVQLIRLLDRFDSELEKLIKNLEPSTQFGADLRSGIKPLDRITGQILKTIGPKSRHLYIYAPEWLEFKEKRANLIRDMGQWARQKDLEAKEALGSIRRVRTELGQLKEKVITETLF